MFADIVQLAAPGTPNGRYIIPVKLWSVRTFGTMTISLDKISIDGVSPQKMGLKNN
jgi:hypothetical protein